MRRPRYVAVALAVGDSLFVETVGSGSASERADVFRARLSPSEVERVIRGPDGSVKFTVFHSHEAP